MVNATLCHSIHVILFIILLMPQSITLQHCMDMSVCSYGFKYM